MTSLMVTLFFQPVDVRPLLAADLVAFPCVVFVSVVSAVSVVVILVLPCRVF